MLDVAPNDVDKILGVVSHVADQLVNGNVAANAAISATISNLILTGMFVLFLMFFISCFVLIYLVTKVTDVMRVDHRLLIQNNAAAVAKGVIQEVSSSASESLMVQFLQNTQDVAANIGQGFAKGYGTPPSGLWRKQ